MTIDFLQKWFPLKSGIWESKLSRFKEHNFYFQRESEITVFISLLIPSLISWLNLLRINSERVVSFMLVNLEIKIIKLFVNLKGDANYKLLFATLKTEKMDVWKAGNQSAQSFATGGFESRWSSLETGNDHEIRFLF